MTLAPGTRVQLSRLPDHPRKEGKIDRVNAVVVGVVDGFIHLHAGAEDLRARKVGDLYYPDATWGERYDLTEIRVEVYPSAGRAT